MNLGTLLIAVGCAVYSEGLVENDFYVGCRRFHPASVLLTSRDSKLRDGRRKSSEHLRLPNSKYDKHVVMTFELCRKFCLLDSASEGLYDFIAVVGNSDCFCLANDTYIGATLSESNCGDHTRYSARIFTTCPHGYYNPPKCQAPCKTYCRMSEEGYGKGKRICRHDGECMACVNELCRTYWGPCQTITSNSKTTDGTEELNFGSLKLQKGLSLFSNAKVSSLDEYNEGKFVLTEINAWTFAKGEATLGIWCPLDGSHHELVGLYVMKCLHCSEKTVTTFKLSPTEYIIAEEYCSYGLHQSHELQSALNSRENFEDYTLVRGSDQTASGAGSYIYIENFAGNISVGESISLTGKTSSLFGASVRLSFHCYCPKHCKMGECNSDTGLCVNGCDPGYLGVDCSQPCPDHTYGSNCSEKCSDLCIDRICHPENGRCVKGCQKSGHYSPFCNTTCYGTGFYGKNCESSCSTNCKYDDVCDYRNGHCPHGCKPGFQPPDCWEKCEDGYFGPDCAFKCGNCSNFQACDKVTGSCIHGCENSTLVGHACACLPGKWLNEDLVCENTCGNCALANSCHDILGTCLTGCKDRFAPPHCKCQISVYGTECNFKCGNCKNVDMIGCDSESGYCLEGCQPGYKGRECVQQCSPGLWGENCSSKCGNCFNHTSCAHDTGECPEEECEPGFKPPMCQCPLDLHGPNCDLKCGVCALGTPCLDNNGTCPHGCENGTEPPLCLCPAGWFGEDCNEECGQCEESTCDPRDGSCSYCKPGYRGHRCLETCRVGMYGQDCRETCGNCLSSHMDCNFIDGKCSLGCQPFYKMPFCHEKCDAGTYGTDCSQQCGQCLNNAPCDVRDGSCHNGCEGLAVPPLCIGECPEGFYGPTCNNTCGECANGTNCNPVTGACPVCEEIGMQPPLCQEPCNSGTYGASCTKRCGMCRAETVCNHIDGRCPDGCRPAFEPPFCQGCKEGYCGFHCLGRCGECVGGLPCNADNCLCPHGCHDGTDDGLCGATFPESTKDLEVGFQQQFSFTFDLASWGVSSCPPGIYGSNCTKKCGQCLETDVDDKKGCEQNTGICVTKQCKVGFEPPLCQRCMQGYFGYMCFELCGFCVKNEPCRRTDGACLHGCADGYQLPDCKTKCAPGTFGKHCKFLCGKCLNPKDCDFVSGACQTGCVLGWVGDKCETKIGAEGVLLLKTAASQATLVSTENCSLVTFILVTVILVAAC